MADVKFRTDELHAGKYLSVRDGWPPHVEQERRNVWKNGSFVQERQACNMQAEDKIGDVRVT
jgi:hypothetical protein